ncbi:MAG TPA: CdaR family protein [Armatimonadota bacterium]|jgi:YbbR domain-containing protein
MSQMDRVTLIIAVALGVFLWAYVRVAHDTPESTRIIRDVPVQLEGKSPSGYASKLHAEDQTIDVEIKGVAERVSAVTRDEVVVRLNVSGVTKSQAVLTPMVVLPRDIRVARAPKVTLITYALRQQTFPVKVAFIAQPPPGTMVGEYLVQPATVTVEGSAEALDQVKYVTVRVDPGEPLTSEREVVPHVVDIDGERITDVHVLTSSVKLRMVSLTGKKTTRQVAVGAPELHNMPRGYTVRVTRITPAVVTLNGDGSLLDRVQGFVSTDAVDVRDMRKNMTMTVRLHPPKGLSVVEGLSVQVDLDVQPVP